jgi:dTDP-4-dehydrorhamnose 3,5-epimerase
MEFIKTEIDGLLIIKPDVFEDERGYFFESFNAEKFKISGIDVRFRQDNESKSKKGVVRGLHCQAPPFAQDKLVRVIKGAVIDVAVDIRKGSPTYGKHVSVKLTEQNKLMFWIPKGFAHGFATLEDDTIFFYKCTEVYNKEAEQSIIWNDPDLGIDWGVDNPVTSERDKLSPGFRKFDSPF